MLLRFAGTTAADSMSSQFGMSAPMALSHAVRTANGGLTHAAESPLRGASAGRRCRGKRYPSTTPRSPPNISQSSCTQRAGDSMLALVAITRAMTKPAASQISRASRPKRLLPTPALRRGPRCGPLPPWICEALAPSSSFRPINGHSERFEPWFRYRAHITSCATVGSVFP
jgi:hypothetical protein